MPDYFIWIDNAFSPAACVSEFEEDAIREGIWYCTNMGMGGTLLDDKQRILGVFIEHYNFDQYMGFIPREMAS